MNKEKNVFTRLLERVYGGLNMSWLNVILYAVATAAVTAIFLIVPVFKNTSFEFVGVTFEAWIFFAVILMANCKTPLESALKTFVFFLVSQPLIYLIQVPFSEMGWGLFGYYRTWFIWTLFTLPMAYIGWYIRKKNWLSVLILLPVIYILTADYVGSFRFAFVHFPKQILRAFFCLGQVLIYLYLYTSDLKQKAAGFLAPLAIMAGLALVRPPVDIDGTNFLPDNPVFSEDAEVVYQSEGIQIQIESFGEDPLIRISTKAFGMSDFTIKDGDREYRYSLRVYEDDNGHTQMEITPLN